MDLMEIRRMLMTMGGNGGMIGELSKYEKKTLTFQNAANSNNWNEGAIIPVSFEPKFIVFYGGTEANGNIISGAMTFNYDSNYQSLTGGCAAVLYKNAANGNVSYGAMSAYPFDGINHTSAAARIQYYNGNIEVTRISGNGYWSNTDSYTFEIYG